MPSKPFLTKLPQLDAFVGGARRAKRGTYLYHVGFPFQCLYVLRSGSAKHSIMHDDGREQVTGFHIAGDIIGFDGIGSGAHMCDAVAIEDSEVLEVRYTDFESASRKMPALQRKLNCLMSDEIVRDHGMMLMLGMMNANERVAVFLLDLSQRYAACGYSPTRLALRMTRQEIGSFLGLKLETVSRVFSHMKRAQLLNVSGKEIEINDLGRLRETISPTLSAQSM